MQSADESEENLCAKRHSLTRPPRKKREEEKNLDVEKETRSSKSGQVNSE